MMIFLIANEGKIDNYDKNNDDIDHNISEVTATVMTIILCNKSFNSI